MAPDPTAARDGRATGSLSRASVLVVGTGGMGLATVRFAAAAGADVVLAGRSSQRLAAAAQGLTAQVQTAAADAEDPGQAAQLLSDHTPLDHVAVLTGGTGSPASSILATPLPAAQQAFGRLWLSYNVLQAAVGAVRPGGSVTLLSGSSGRRPMAGVGVWGTLHGSIEALARSAALELAPIRVNVVSPGGIGMRPDRQLTDHSGQPDDIAAMVVALMSNPAVTGAVVDVDGGERLADS